MSKEKTDLLQGTLDMLILKALQLGSMHGFGISVLIRQIPEGEVLQAHSGWTQATARRAVKLGAAFGGDKYGTQNNVILLYP